MTEIRTEKQALEILDRINEKLPQLEKIFSEVNILAKTHIKRKHQGTIEFLHNVSSYISNYKSSKQSGSFTHESGSSTPTQIVQRSYKPVGPDDPVSKTEQDIKSVLTNNPDRFFDHSRKFPEICEILRITATAKDFLDQQQKLRDEKSTQKPAPITVPSESSESDEPSPSSAKASPDKSPKRCYDTDCCSEAGCSYSSDKTADDSTPKTVPGRCYSPECCSDAGCSFASTPIKDGQATEDTQTEPGDATELAKMADEIRLEAEKIQKTQAALKGVTHFGVFGPRLMASEAQKRQILTTGTPKLK